MKNIQLILIILIVSVSCDNPKEEEVFPDGPTKDTPDKPDNKFIYGTIGFYQHLSLPSDQFSITFRTYVEYDNRIFLPLIYSFSNKKGPLIQTFKPTQDHIAAAIAENKEITKKAAQVKTYIDTMQDELAKRIFLMVAYYGKVGNSFIVKPETAFLLFAAKMVSSLKLEAIPLSDKEMSYEFSIMFDKDQLLFVSIKMNPIVVLQSMKLLKDILMNEHINQKAQIDLMENPEQFYECEKKFAGKQCICFEQPKEKEAFRFKEMTYISQKLRKSVKIEEDEEEEANEAKQQIEDLAKAKAVAVIKKRNQLKEVIEDEVLQSNLYQKLLFEYCTTKKNDEKTKAYLYSEINIQLNKNLRQIQGSSNADLDDVIASKRYKKIFEDNKDKYVKNAEEIIGQEVALDNEIDLKLKKSTSSLNLIINAQAKVLQFYLYQDTAKEEAKEIKQEKKNNEAQQKKIQGEIANSIEKKGKMDQTELIAKNKEKDLNNQKSDLSKFFKERAKKSKIEQNNLLNDLIFDKKFDSSQFDEQFRILQYKHVYKNIFRSIEKDKLLSKKFLQKFNALFLPTMGYEVKEDEGAKEKEGPGGVTLESIEESDIQKFVMEKVGDESLPIDLCRDQILDNYFYHGGYLKGEPTFKYLDKAHLAKEQQLARRRR